MYLGEFIKQYRTEYGLSMQAFADKCNLSKGYIAMLERNINSKNGETIVPSVETFIKVANVTRLTLDELLEMVDENQPISISDGKTISQFISNPNIHSIESRTLPVLGSIACGEPIYAEEDREYITLEDAPRNADFILIAKGDSMINARIYDGDYVFIRKQSEVHNGEIAAVIIDDEATLKRVYFDKEQETMTLVAENPAYAPMVYSGDKLEQIKVLGKAISFQSEVR